MNRHPQRFIWIITLLTLLASLATACNSAPTAPDEKALVAAVVATLEAQGGTAPINLPAAPDAPLPGMDMELQTTLVNLYQRINMSVVSIIVDSGGFAAGSGSGFVYDDAGHLVTNSHVVADGDQFEVVFANGDHRRGELVGQDVDGDLAVLQIDALPVGARPLALGDIDSIQVGQFVVAIGNPFGEQGSMSLGIVSGLGRSLTSQRTTDLGGSYRLPRVIQTDAPINPGNSGGPLLDLNGTVVGVNAAIRTETGVNSGVGFSIPVDAVKRIVPSLIEKGSYEYPYMGVSVLSPGDLGLDFQETLDLPKSTGVYVTQLVSNGPAEAAGLQASGGARPGGDLIVRIDGREVRNFDDLNSYLVFETSVGQTIQVTVLRGNEELTLPVVLGARP